MTPTDRGFVGAAEPDIDRLSAVHASLHGWLGRQTDHAEAIGAIATELTGHAMRWKGAHGPLLIRVTLLDDRARVEVLRPLDPRRCTGRMTTRCRLDVGAIDGVEHRDDPVIVQAELGQLRLQSLCRFSSHDEGHARAERAPTSA
jgi:hypothetical protein